MSSIPLLFHLLVDYVDRLVISNKLGRRQMNTVRMIRTFLKQPKCWVLQMQNTGPSRMQDDHHDVLSSDRTEVVW